MEKTYWIKSKINDKIVICSKCGFTSPIFGSNKCYNCKSEISNMVEESDFATKTSEEIEKLATKINKIDIDWVDIKNKCRTTVGKDGTNNVPSSKFKLDLLISEHSPIRLGHINFSWKGIKSWVATH